MSELHPHRLQVVQNENSAGSLWVAPNGPQYDLGWGVGAGGCHPSV